MADTADTTTEKRIKKKGGKKRSEGSTSSPDADAERLSSAGSALETPIADRDADDAEDGLDEEQDLSSAVKRFRMDKGSTVLVNQASTIPPEFLEAPVTSKKITNFFDFLTRSDAAGHAYDISKRNALIKKDAKKEIYYQMIIHSQFYGLSKPEDWDTMDSKDLEPLLLKVFKSGHKEASLGDRLRKLVIKYRIQSGYPSLFEYLKRIDTLLEEYEETDEAPTPAQEAQYVKLLLDQFPSDALHKRLRQLIEDEGKPATLAEFRQKVLLKGGRLHDSFSDMVACGLCTEDRADNNLKDKRPTKDSKPNPRPPKTATNPTVEPHRGCGRVHTGDCIYRKHPDFNSTDLDWDKSPKGLAWAANGEQKLPHSKTLDPNAKWSPPSFAPTTSKDRKRERGEDYLFNIIDHISSSNDSNTIPFTLRAPRGVNREVDVFIDTGAVNGNYISKDIANFLVENHVEYCTCVTEVCSPINNSCYMDYNNKLFKLNIFNQTANFDFTFEATILESKYDIIVGRPTIKQFNLLRIFDRYFLNEDELNLAPKKRNKLVHQRIDHARKSQPPIAETSSSRPWISSTLAMVTNGVRSIPIKEFLHALPRDDDELDSFYKETPWEVEVPVETNNNTASDTPIPKFEGSDDLQMKVYTLYSAYKDIFSTHLNQSRQKLNHLN